MKRTAWILVLAVVCTTFLAARGSQESKSTALQAAAERVKIKILHYIGNKTHIAAWNDIMAKYTEQNPNVTFDSQNMTQTEYFTQLRTRIAAGDAPDMMMGQPSQYPDIIDSGYIMDLSNSPVIEKLKLTKADLGDCSFRGKVHALPLDFKVTGVFYNKDIYDKYGLTKPQTFKNLMQIGTTLKNNGVDPWVRGYAYNVYPDIEVRSIFWPALQENGKYDAFEKLMNGTARFHDYPEFATAMRLWTERLVAFNRMDDMSNDYTKARQIFMSGGAAMIYEGTWAVGQLFGFNPDMRLDMFAMPREDGKPNGYPYQIDKLFMVNGKSTHLDAVIKFVEFLISPAIGGYWAAQTLQPSVITGVEVEMPDIIKEAMKAKEEGRIAHAGLWTAQLYGEFNVTWRTQLQGYAAEKKYDINAFTDKLQAAFDDIVKSLKK